MPREIADSDDELNLIPSPLVSNIDIVEGIATSGGTRDFDQLDPVFNTAFDDFLSPTQRLSSYDGSHENTNDIDTSKFLDSSTNRFLEALAPSSNSPSQNISDADTTSQLVDPDMGGKRSKDKGSVRETAGHKRSWTKIDEVEASSKGHESTKKRAKTTRGSSGAPNMKSKDALDFEAAMYDSKDATTGSQEDGGEVDGDVATYPPEMVSVDARTDYTSPLDLSLHLSPANGAQITNNGHSVIRNASLTRYVPHHSYTPQGDFFGANLRGGTTSNSSMGNYQSFSINPEKLGMDFDKINPFGSLSQVSLPGDLDSEETRGIAEIFRNSASYNIKASSVNGGDMNNGLVYGIENDMQTSPIKSVGARRTAKSQKAERDDAQSSPPFSPITNPDDQNIIDENIASRRRDQEASAVVEIPEAKAAPKKRGRKPKNQKSAQPLEPERTSIDELHSEEQLVNRVTRAGTVDSLSNASEVSQATNSSKTGKKRKPKKSSMDPPDLQSKKLPSSDPGLDNKAVIGLSPERYVPRLSKRRGRVDPQTLDSNDANGALAEGEVGPTDEVVPRAVSTKGKKGRKSKAQGVEKLAVTSIKQDDEVPAEDVAQEAEEVMDAEPSGVKAPSPSVPETGPDQKSNIETTIGEDEEDRDDVVTRGNTRRTNVSVNIPVLPKSDDQQDLGATVAEPKKRGRKRKKALEDTPAESKEDEAQRPTLGERDPNIQAVKKKVAESTMEDEPQQKDENGCNSEKEQTPVAQPEARMATTPSKRNSAPSKPLSSTPLFNARARIGLSKRHSIPSLLRKVDRNKEAPKAIEKKEKLTKRHLEEREQERIAREEAEAEGREFKPLDQLRDKDGRLVEWDF